MASGIPGSRDDRTLSCRGALSNRPILSPCCFNHAVHDVGRLFQISDANAPPCRRLPFLLEEKSQVAVRPDLGLFRGLGLAIERARPDAYFHRGANPGFQSFFLCQPATGRGILF